MNPLETRFDRLQTAPRLLGLFERFYYGRPFLNKNNSNTLRIIELQHVFQNALFVHVTRDITATVLSVMKGRAENGIAPDQFWSVAPDKSLLAFNFRDELELVVFQYLFCNRFVEIANHKLQLGIINVDYDEFCLAPMKLTSTLATEYTRVSGGLLDTRETDDADITFEVRGNSNSEMSGKINIIQERLDDQVNDLAGALCDQAIHVCEQECQNN